MDAAGKVWKEKSARLIDSLPFELGERPSVVRQALRLEQPRLFRPQSLTEPPGVNIPLDAEGTFTIGPELR